MVTGRSLSNSLLSVLVFLSLSKLMCIEGAVLPESAEILSSPRVTDWGEWGDLDRCPDSTYVIGMRLKTEPAQGPGDDTALNGISFMCGLPRESQKVLHSSARQIQSRVGEWGTWGVSYECPGSYAVGFQLRSEHTQRNKDDTAANNLRIFCSSSDSPGLNYLEGSGLGWGTWTEAQFCPFGSAMCGLRTQVESSKGHGGDDTALNNLDVLCCPITQ